MEGRTMNGKTNVYLHSMPSANTPVPIWNSTLSFDLRLRNSRITPYHPSQQRRRMVDNINVCVDEHSAE